MNKKTQTYHTIAVIGAGPAGSMAAALLAGAGHKVLLFERKGGAWEKPCGGGITSKGIARYPFLHDTLTQKKSIQHIELLDSVGRRLRLPLRAPLYVYSRKALNELLLRRAIAAGAQVIQAHVKSFHLDSTTRSIDLEVSSSCAVHPKSGQPSIFRADFMVVANGAKSSLAESLAHNFTMADYSSAMGYHLPIQENFIRLKFLKNFKGYIWTFPRSDHVSLGICSKLSEHAAGELKSLLREFCRHTYNEDIPAECHFYSALIPTPELETLKRLKLVGPCWALAGDAAGFVDPITGEGIYYALRSAELLANAILEGHPEEYPDRIRKDFGSNHQRAAQLMPRFYTGRFWGSEFTTRMIQFGRASRTIHSILTQLFEEPDYINLKSHLKQNLGRAMMEFILGLRPRNLYSKDARADGSMVGGPAPEVTIAKRQ